MCLAYRIGHCTLVQFTAQSQERRESDARKEEDGFLKARKRATQENHPGTAGRAPPFRNGEARDIGENAPRLP